MVYDNNVLVFNDLSKIQKPKLSGDFWAYDLFTLETLWHGKDVERVFFNGKLRKETPKEDDDNSGRLMKEDLNNKELKERDSHTPFAKKLEEKRFEEHKILVLCLKVTEYVDEEAKKDEEEAKKDEDDAKKEEKKDKDADAKQQEREIHYEFFELEKLTDEFERDEPKFKYSDTTLLPLTTGEPVKLTLAETLKKARDEKARKATATPKGGAIQFKFGGLADKEDNKEKEEEKPNVIYAHDHELNEVVMIEKGGEKEGVV